jgi:hypothetical protein
MANPDLFTDYRFLFKSVDPLLNFENEGTRLFKEIQLSDSIFDFFPYGEILIDDKTGFIADKINFSEGELFNLQIGSEDGGYITNQYCWSENQINDIELETYLSGINNFILLSSQFQKDYPTSNVYKTPISDIVSSIAQNIYGISTDKIFISKTIENYKSNEISDYNYQLLENHSEYIQRLSTFAHKGSDNKSPFFTFINFNGEFYFKTMADLFDQSSIGTYEFVYNLDMMTREDSIKDWSLAFTGMPTNKENWKKQIYSTNNEAASVVEDDKLEDHVKNIKDINGTPLIRKSIRNRDVQDYPYFGIVNDVNLDKPFFEGSKNGLYIDSSACYRLPITISFNPKAVSGKKLTLKVSSSFDNKLSLTEYSTDWIIGESKIYSDADGAPYQRLELVRPNIQIDSNHPLKKDFK